MVFSSLIFLYVFLPLSLLAYFLCRSMRGKNISLLIFSLLFYSWGEPKFVLLLILMSAADWFFALKIDQCKVKEDPAGMKAFLACACAVNIGLIGYFKYSKLLCSLFGSTPEFILRIALPLGISFYTFQLLTYVIDVYRGDAKAEKKFWHVLLYAALFHQCIAGPIVRYNSIADELFVQRSRQNEIPEGILRFSSGLFKKVVIANGCGAIAESFLLSDAMIENAGSFAANMAELGSQTVLGLWLGVVCYTLQIYFDFSAYSDMAIGMGKAIGLHYPENFNYPYISASVTDFWRRWHMSLSTFFRDYVYIPLGGNRKGKARTILNLFIVWALTGLWHGASMNFILWGLYFFVFLMIEKLFLRRSSDSPRKKGLRILPNVFSRVYLLLVVMIGWVLFRYTDMRYIPVVLKGLAGLNGNALTDFETSIRFSGNVFFLAFSILCCTPLFRSLYDLSRRYETQHKAAAVFNSVFIYTVIPVLLLIISTAELVGATFNPFLYFRF